VALDSVARRLLSTRAMRTTRSRFGALALVGLLHGGCDDTPDAAPSSTTTTSASGSTAASNGSVASSATGSGAAGSGGAGDGAGGDGAGGVGAGGVGAGGESAAGGAGGASTGAGDFEPYFFDDFEGYADGASLGNNAPFDAAGRTFASSAQAHRGQQSAQMGIRDGDGGGFGQWGGLLPIDPAVARGGEVWVRLYVYWPSDFEFSAAPWMKFLRLHNRASDGENAGYNDLYVDRADETMSVLRTIKEVHDVWAVHDGPRLPRDTWERYEMYLFVDDVPVDEGGDARVRIWRDDALIFDRTDVPTITESGGVIDYFYLFTYWNNEAPPDNECWVDDLAIATDASPPPWTDAAGNPWIGDW
jgi:hypothetical protein